MRWRIAFCFCLVALTACAPGATTERLPTRAPTPTYWPTPTPISAQVYYEQGLSLREAGRDMGDVDAALRAFTWAIEQSPDFAPAYVARGQVYLAEGNLERALADAEAALDADPRSAEAYVLRAEALRREGRDRLALRSFELALTLDPTLASDLFRSRWLLALAVGDGSRLSSLSEEYAAAHSEDPLRHYYLSWSEIEMGRSAHAINALAPEIEALSDPPGLLWFTLGHAYAAEGLWEEAIIAFEATRGLIEAGDTSLALHSAHPAVDLSSALGRAYLESGRCTDAEAMLTHAVALGAPESDLASMLEEARICQTPTPEPTTTPSPW